MDTKALRQKILDLAIRGKLVPQDPTDEPASVLLERIRAEKERLIAEGKIKRPKRAKTHSSESHYQKVIPPFPIPDSWEWVRLGDMLTVKSGESLNVRDLQSINEYPIYGGNGINGFYDKYNVDKATLIIGRVGFYCGCIHRTNSEAWVTDNALIVSTFPSSIYIDWLEYALNWSDLRNTSNSTAQPVVSGKSIYPVVIPLPPYQEQRTIASQLKRIEHFFELIDTDILLLSKNISDTKSKILELAMQGRLVPQDPADEPAADMLRRVNPKARITSDTPHYPKIHDIWALTTIDSVCNYGHCTTVPVENIKDEDWILELEDIEKDSGRVKVRQLKSHRKITGVRHQFNKGDILYSKLRTYLNKVLLAETDGYCTTEIIPISCDESINPHYLLHWLRSPYFLNYTLSCGYGVKMPRLSTSDARNGIVPLPPANEQKRIVARIEELFTILDEIERSLN